MQGEKKIMQKLVWNVYAESFNRKEIVPYNIFEHSQFAEEVKNAFKKYKDDFPSFEKSVKSNLRYYFWSKSEWEIILGPWLGQKHKDEMEIKIDVADQVLLNWDIFIKYVWDHYTSRRRIKK